MSALLVRAALETALAAMTPTLAYAWENSNYTPVVGTPYAGVALLLAQPANNEIGGNIYTEQGFLQVSLAYPLDTGPAAAATRAELIRATFKRGASFTASGVTVNIERTPEIAPGRIEKDRYFLPVKIRFFAHIIGS